MARDSEGATIGPLEFALTAGSHTLTVVSPQQDIIFYSLAFIKPEEIKSYAKVASSYDIKSLDADVIKIEGEAADVKSSNSIIPKSNNSNAGMTPSHKYLTKINYIGGTSWKHSGSTITWNFNVEKSGYYYLNMRYKQSDLVNGDGYIEDISDNNNGVGFNMWHVFLIDMMIYTPNNFKIDYARKIQKGDTPFNLYVDWVRCYQDLDDPSQALWFPSGQGD